MNLRVNIVFKLTGKPQVYGQL